MIPQVLLGGNCRKRAARASRFLFDAVCIW
jgi:hypothetical protein